MPPSTESPLARDHDAGVAQPAEELVQAAEDAGCLIDLREGVRDRRVLR